MKILEKYKEDLDLIGKNLSILIDDYRSTPYRSTLPNGLSLFPNPFSNEAYSLIYYYHGAPLIGLYYTEHTKCLYIPTSILSKKNDIHSRLFPKENIICKNIEWNDAYDKELIEKILSKVLPCTFKKYDVRLKLAEQKEFLANREKNRQKEIKLDRNKQKLEHFLELEF